VSGTGLLCFVIVFCAGKYLITNTLIMSESELFLLESPCFHDKCLKFEISFYDTKNFTNLVIL